MLTGTVSLTDALFVAISSMLVVFAVLLVLYGLVLLFPLIFRARQGPVPAAADMDMDIDMDTDTDEALLVAVITATLQAARRNTGGAPTAHTGKPRG